MSSTCSTTIKNSADVFHAYNADYIIGSRCAFQSERCAYAAVCIKILRELKLRLF